MSGEYRNAPSGPTGALAERLCGNRRLQKPRPMRHLENVQGPARQLFISDGQVHSFIIVM